MKIRLLPRKNGDIIAVCASEEDETCNEINPSKDIAYSPVKGKPRIQEAWMPNFHFNDWKRTTSEEKLS